MEGHGVDRNVTVDALRERLLKTFSEFPNLVCKDDTDIVIEGYPRSSNSFTFWMLTVLGQGRPPLRIAHHTHRIENLQIGQLLGKPTVVLIRPPADAILSFMIYHDLTVERAAQRYIDFYTGVLELPERPAVFRFADIITDFNKVVRHVNAVTGAGIPLSADMAADTAKAHAKSRDLAEKVHGDKVVERLAVPLAERELLKRKLRGKVQAHMQTAPELQRLHDRIDALADLRDASADPLAKAL
jgi:hypothetical protein